MIRIDEIDPTAAGAIRVVFTDIDDTLTTEGQLRPEAYAALWRLHDAGIDVVPVTGRPAGWCDHIARMWPVRGVIGENGALAFVYDRAARRMLALFAEEEPERRLARERLEQLQEIILREVPGCGVASDQPYRLFDLAIDYCEDVPPLGRVEVQRILALFEESGAVAKVSSIHVNGWFGRFDKLTMIRRFAREVLEVDLDHPLVRQGALYVGDSPNDEPAFRFFDMSVGVANVWRFLDRLTAPPRFVTREVGGAGFAEAVAVLLTARARGSQREG